MKNYKLLIFLILISVFHANAQERSKANIGLGMGIDFGGFGTRITYSPAEWVGTFGAVGYNLNSISYNFGAQLKIPSKRLVTPYITAMYGYNAVLIVNGIKTKTTYYGFTTGAGLEINLKNRKSFFSVELLVPIRPKAFHDSVDALETLGYEIKYYPVAISIGYHFRF